MTLHEGSFLKGILITYIEGLSAATYRTILRLTEWLDTLSAEKLNRIVLYVRVWHDRTSSAVAGDTLVIVVKSYGREWTREVVAPGSVGGSFNPVRELKFRMPYPNGINPSTSNNTLMKVKCGNWSATETHRYLIEVSAYLLAERAEAVEVSFV